MPLQKAKPPNLFSENGPAITLPPPLAVEGHRRSRSTAELPPLFTRSSSSSPTRLSTFLPSLRSPSRTASPERVTPAEAAEYEVEEQETSQRPKTSGVAKSLASWFDGASDPVNIGLVPSPKKEKDNPLQSEATTDTMFSNSTESVDTLTKRPARPSSQAPSATSATRFSFFRKQSTTPTLTQTEIDQLGTIDIRDALFPQGPADELSPAAFKNLQLNAEGTLRKFQTAHLEQQKQIRKLNITNTSQADDLEASQVRSEHLKLQLVEMAERASEQERLITALRNELAAIHNPNSDAELELAQSSVRKVPSLDISATYQTARSKRNRVSDISSADSSEQSDRYSIFSADPRLADSPGTSVAPSPVMKHASMHFATVSPAIPQHEHSAVSVIPVTECQKCHNVRANEAWDVITMMKLESQALKDRIEELEGANDQALDLLGGLGSLRLDDLGLK
jgi:hypothetical protein